MALPLNEDRPTFVLPAAAAGPHFRWGTTATSVTAGLSALLLLSLYAPDLTRTIVSVFLQVAGGLALFAYVLLNIPIIRYNLLKVLLKWRWWAYHPRSGFSRLYLGLTSYLGGTKPKLWSLQSSLPALPVPPLEQTCKFYLQSVQPLITAEEFEVTTKLVNDFKKPGGIGEKLQAQLESRAKAAKTSWILEWWEDMIYLQSRYPLPVFSNWYGLDRIDPILRTPAARAANLVNGLLQFKRMIDTQQLEPNRVQATVPLCMWQYSRVYGTVRIPDEPQDRLELHPKSKHIVVLSNGRIFKLDVFDESGQLSPTDIQIQFTRILQETEGKDPKDEPGVAALTSGDRTTWANQRKQLIEMDEVNKKSLEIIESALFVFVFDEDSPSTVEELAIYGMHRKGKPIWFDKNFNITIFKNGRFAANVDHTFADASVMVHIFDFVFSVESSVDHWVTQDTKDVQHLPAPLKLEWKIVPEFKKEIETAQEKLNMLCMGIEINVLKFQPFGKGLVKKFNMSPDAFCQMAIQLAYYRLHKSLPLTYESAATVRFHHGRTETVRSASNESKDFVEAMDDPKETDAVKLKKLSLAVKRHVKTMRSATNGDGIDRHLMALRILGTATGSVPEIFKDVSYNLKFKLSTSQTPAVGMLGGGFAPIAEDGYAVSYVVAEERLWFHISTYATCPTTSATKYSEELRRCLLDMQMVCFSNPALQNLLSKRVYRIQRAE